MLSLRNHEFLVVITNKAKNSYIWVGNTGPNCIFYAKNMSLRDYDDFGKGNIGSGGQFYELINVRTQIVARWKFMNLQDDL